jgi:hypothetical protein
MALFSSIGLESKQGLDLCPLERRYGGILPEYPGYFLGVLSKYFLQVENG